MIMSTTIPSSSIEKGGLNLVSKLALVMLVGTDEIKKYFNEGLKKKWRKNKKVKIFLTSIMLIM